MRHQPATRQFWYLPTSGKGSPPTNAAPAGKTQRRRRGPRHRVRMRINTKVCAAKRPDGQPLSVTTETSLKPEQLLELYRYLKLTRLVEERMVNLYRQTKVVGGVFRSLGQEATAVGSRLRAAADDFITPIIRDLGAVFVKGIRPRADFRAVHGQGLGTFRRQRSQRPFRRHGEGIPLVPSRISAT